jgi:Asp-tRNA(Asn)/Glu-tRNA(Gln) amidotransferase A subunit family amidase/ketopantoate reductase
MNEAGVTLEGPLEQFTVPVRAVSPDELPDGLGAVLLAVKHQHTRAALEAIAPRLADDGYVVSLQNGINEPLIAAAVGPERTVGAFVNFGADYLAPGRIHYAGRGTFVVGELDGRESERVAALARDLEARATDNVMGYLWAKEAYGAMLFAGAVSDLSIADSLAEPRYRALFTGVAREALADAQATPEPFDGFDANDLDGSIERLVEFNRRSAKTHSGIYRDLAVRKRPVEPLLDGLGGPLIARTNELIKEIEAGRRVCEVANLELLAAHARMEAVPELNAVITPLAPSERAATGPLKGVVVAVKDNIDVRGVVTTNSSTVCVPPPAAEDAAVVVRLRGAAAELLCKTNLLEYAAGSVNPAYGMTYNPHDTSRTSGGSSSGSAALVAAGVCDHALGTDTGGSIRIPAAYCGIVGVKPTFGLVPEAGVTALCPTLDHVGTLTRTVEQSAALLAVLAGREMPLADVPRPRVGVLRVQTEDPDLTPGVRAAVAAALEGWDLVDVELPDLATAEEALLGPIILFEAYAEHRDRLRREGEKYGPGTRALLELGAQVSESAYREALAGLAAFKAAVARAFDGVDVLAGPTVAYTAPPEDPPVGTPEGELEGRFTGPWNLAGVPAVSLPCGTAEDGLPVGLQLAAPAGADAHLLSVAREFERRFA